MKSPLSRLYRSGPAPGEDDKRLAAYLDEKRDDGVLIFSIRHLPDPEIMIALHKEHADNIRKQANLAEKVANGR